ncbi:hypothetical protein AKO1_011932 [Acrasis kona]|uniref:GMP phosphodiesterase delta subunit domain-containing protein n=1 Tax=Acrasis kona TaxID=1008807 RepID=A0AAW2Z8D0_9EUKA
MASPQTRKPKPDEVLKHTKPTDSFLCPLSANTAGIQFLQFKIRNTEDGSTIFETSAEESAKELLNLDSIDENALRTIKYQFDKSFLRTKSIGTTDSLVFQVGDKPVQNFRMIERHYFKEKLLKSFDFNFKFCIPNSVNSWECIYEMPTLSEKEAKEIEDHPYETKSDSFYFVNDGDLIMHNKASYAYVDKK